MRTMNASINDINNLQQREWRMPIGIKLACVNGFAVIAIYASAILGG